MNLPKISIITPSLNQGDFLEETILSVLNQNYPNLEYIIVDGGSEDESIDIIKKYSSRISYWESNKDNGQSAAINKGLKRCTGDIVTWLNSDDCYLDGTLHKVAEYFKKSSHALIYGKTILFGEKRKEKIKGVSNGNDISLKCLAYVPFPQPSTFFRKQVLTELGYLDESLHYGMDHDLFARIALNYDILGVDDIFSRYRYHETSKSNLLLKFVEERNKVFSKVLRSFPDSLDCINELKSLGYYDVGKDFYHVSKSFISDELKRAFVYFLEVQMHYYYIALDMKNAKAIAKYLLDYNNQSINKEDAKKIRLRTTLLNKRLVFFLRKFTQD